MLNTSASTDARHSRSGKDAMLYDEDGNALAQVNSFQTKAAFNNNKYNPIGQNMELEVNNTIGVTITISEIVVLDGYLFNQVINAVQKGESPVMTLDGAIEGRNGSQERVTYRECIFPEIRTSRMYRQVMSFQEVTICTATDVQSRGPL